VPSALSIAARDALIGRSRERQYAWLVHVGTTSGSACCRPRRLLRDREVRRGRVTLG
jgi:hypothetical protein